MKEQITISSVEHYYDAVRWDIRINFGSRAGNYVVMMTRNSDHLYIRKQNINGAIGREVKFGPKLVGAVWAAIKAVASRHGAVVSIVKDDFNGEPVTAVKIDNSQDLGVSQCALGHRWVLTREQRYCPQCSNPPIHTKRNPALAYKPETAFGTTPGAAGEPLRTQAPVEPENGKAPAAWQNLSNDAVLRIAPMAGDFSPAEVSAFCGGFRRCAQALAAPSAQVEPENGLPARVRFDAWLDETEGFASRLERLRETDLKTALWAAWQEALRGRV